MIHSEDEALQWLQSSELADVHAMSRLHTLLKLLSDENERQNLVSAPSLEQAWVRHVADSAQLLTHVPRETPLNRWLDLGTGAGFPGLVIAALRPNLDVILVESRRRRVEWLEFARDEIALSNVSVEGRKLEQVPSAQVDVISARAFAPLALLIEQAARFSTRRTLWLLPKGRSAAQELSELRGWQHAFHVEPSLTDAEAGIVIGTLAGRKG